MIKRKPFWVIVAVVLVLISISSLMIYKVSLDNTKDTPKLDVVNPSHITEGITQTNKGSENLIHNQENIDIDIDTDIEIENEGTTQDESPKLPDVFLPSKFIINTFDVQYNENNTAIDFKMTYSISPEIYDVLSKGENDYFSIEVPAVFTPKEITNPKTALVEGTKPEDGNLGAFAVIFTYPLEIETHIDLESEKFNLYVYDVNKEVFSIFVDINAYKNITPHSVNEQLN